MSPETKQELKMLALELAGLNHRAQDLVSSCPEHGGTGIANAECDNCAPLIAVCQQIGKTQQRYHFARHATEWADVAASLEETPEPERPRRRWWWGRRS